MTPRRLGLSSGLWLAVTEDPPLVGDLRKPSTFERRGLRERRGEPVRRGVFQRGLLSGRVNHDASRVSQGPRRDAAGGTWPFARGIAQRPSRGPVAAVDPCRPFDVSRREGTKTAPDFVRNPCEPGAVLGTAALVDGLGGSAGSTRLDYLLEDKHRGLVGVVVPLTDDDQRPVPKVNAVTETPVRHRTLELRRLGGIALHRFEPEQKTQP